MSKTEGHAGKTAKKNTNTAAERVTRWRRHVADAIERTDGNPNAVKYGMDIPSKWFEEVEGRPMADVVTDWLCENRGIGEENPSPEQEYNQMIDRSYARGTTRQQNIHMRETAHMAVMFHLTNHTRLPVGEDMHDLVRLFYRKGDRGIDNAVVRAIKCAIAWEREARANG